MSQSDIIIVDDIADNLTVLSTILEKEGHRVRPAINGQLALQAVDFQVPDLVLLDIRMPGMSGFDICKRLKANKKTEDIPIIFISALNEIGDKVKAFSMGGVDYITKPFQSDEVCIRVQTHLALAKQRQHIEELNRIQSQMIDLVTHNLKTSLATIMMSSEMIQRVTSDDVTKYVSRINRASEHIDNLINDFFDLNHLDSSTTLIIKEIDANELIQVIIDRFDVSADQNHIDLLTQLPDTPLIFHSDSRLLVEALNNLVSNALKYTPSGGSVTLTAIQCEEKIVIEVKDNGSGIHPDLLARIFDRFYRLPEHKSAGIPGTGLGLSITESIIQRLGGNIRVESQLDEGTLFQVSLPL